MWPYETIKLKDIKIGILVVDKKTSDALYKATIYFSKWPLRKPYGE
jgi:hypothetical protein